MKATRIPNLEERIKAIRAEINSIIDQRVDTRNCHTLEAELLTPLGLRAILQERLSRGQAL